MTKKELQEKKVAELRAIAKRLGISLKSRLKDDIVEEVSKASRRAAAKKTTAKKKPARKKAAPPAGRKKTAVKKTPVAKKKTRTGGAKKVAAVGKKAKAPARKAPPSAAPKKKAVVKKPAVPPVGKAAPAVKPSAAKSKKLPAAGPPPARKPTRRAPHYTISASPPSSPGRMKPLLRPVEEDGLTVIVLDPCRLFACWELTEKTFRKGVPALRIYNVERGVDFDGENALGFFDVPVSGPTGSVYVGLLPGREFYVDLGVVTAGDKFVTLKRSGRLFTPHDMPGEGESVLPEEYFTFTPWPSPSS